MGIGWKMGRTCLEPAQVLDGIGVGPVRRLMWRVERDCVPGLLVSRGYQFLLLVFT